MLKNFKKGFALGIGAHIGIALVESICKAIYENIKELNDKTNQNEEKETE